MESLKTLSTDGLGDWSVPLIQLGYDLIAQFAPDLF